MHDIDNRRSSYDGTLTKQRDPLEVKADAEQGILTGYASKYWVVDSYGEVTAPGAFAKTISERGPQGANRIHLRYEHQVTIGSHRTMVEDPIGLLIEAKVSDDGADGTRVRRHLADGVKYGLSIGFRRISDRSGTPDDPLDYTYAPNWVRQMPPEDIRVLTGVGLMENSVVSFPAVDSALIETYRSEDILTDEQVRAMFKRGDAAFDRLYALLTPEERAYLKQLLNSATAGDDGNTETAVPRTDQTSRRNYVAEFELLTGVKL